MCLDFRYGQRQGASSVLCCSCQAHIGQKEKTREEKKSPQSSFWSFKWRSQEPVCNKHLLASEKKVCKERTESFTTAERVSARNVQFFSASLVPWKFCKPKKRGEESCKTWMRYSCQSGANDYMKSIVQRHKHSLLAAVGGCYEFSALYKVQQRRSANLGSYCQTCGPYWSVKMFWKCPFVLCLSHW